MICFIRQWVAEHVPEAEIRMVRLGNLYITKGETENGYPTLVCHLDQIQMLHSDDFEVGQDGDKLYGWSESNQRQEGLGADDKNGIYVCLRCLEECPCLNVFMAVGEEKGCIGSNRADMSFFADSLYVLEPDCKGGKEPHTVLRGIPCASEEFIEALQLETNGYTLTEGKTSDILALTFNNIGVSCINLPVGYHNPHKDDEYTLLPELEYCLTFVKQTVNTLHKRFQHEYRSETQRKVNEFLKEKQRHTKDFSNKKFKYFEDNGNVVEIEFEECSSFYEYCGFMICDAPFHFVENGNRSSGNYPHGIIAMVDGEYFWFTSKESCINSFNTKNRISGFTD